ncbi:MAG: low-specificity L-threonine aldolase [Thiothrix sp.]|nr:MAG: low-specificity L-threonine aldolase [Thiothrix sp.]
MSQYAHHQPLLNLNTRMIDLRSDTVTQPTAAMKQAMVDAPLGDDVYEEDPTVKALEQGLASLLNKEAALFFPSGTQSNLAALLCHCQRGEEVIVGEQYHTFLHEARGASVLGGIAMHPLPTSKLGRIEIDDLLAAIKPDDIHDPISKLLALENTVSGCVQDQAHLTALAEAAHARGLSVHLDGARFFNAVVKQNKTPAELAALMDSVSICLSKGLGTPAGSVLVGAEKLIRYAKRQRKILGGGMRQSGMLAGAGLYALENNIERLAIDHENTRIIAEALAQLPQLEVDQERLQTNMFFIKPRPEDHAPLQAFMAENGVRIGWQQPWMRCVLHLGVSAEDVIRIIELFRRYYQS